MTYQVFELKLKYFKKDWQHLIPDSADTCQPTCRRYF